MSKEYKYRETVFLDIDDVLEYGIDETWYSEPCMYGLTREIEHQMWERYTHYDRNGILTLGGWYDGCVPYKGEEDVKEFQVGEELTLYDFLQRLSTPFWGYHDEEEDAMLRSWKVKVQTDKLSYCLESKYGMLYSAYVWHDGQVHITNTNWMKNADWHELFECLCLSSRYEESLSSGGSAESYVLLVDRECGSPLWDMYEWVTCGLKINLKRKTITVDSKDKAVKTFHCLSNRSHENAWSSTYTLLEDYPEEIRKRYEKPEHYSQEYERKMFQDWLELIILPDGSISPLRFDCSTEEGIRKVKKYVQDWVKIKEK